ncbi:MAG: alpha/beta fold hydrolase [Candidatus Acidiferrales bacterium]
MSDGLLTSVTQAREPAPLVEERGRRSWAKEFEVHPWLQNPHLMTVLAAYWPRDLSHLSRPTERLVEIEPGTRLLAKCHWQATPQRHPTIILVHGLEGSSESSYMLGTAEKAFAAGFNVVRMNQRNCGGTEHLTPTLDHSGLAGDYRTVLDELIAEDGLPEVFFIGYSIGGNLVLKMAGELGAQRPAELRGICAVSPCLDLALSANGCAEPRNFLYESYFLQSVKNRMHIKAKLFPERYCQGRMPRARTLREWHEAVTAPAWGYRDADDYYQQASALPVVEQIRVPTLILTAQDDPLIPIASFRRPEIAGNSFIKVVATERGGHCAFISCNGGDERFWAESRVVEFCLQLSQMPKERERQ